ncbi:MAG: deoxyribodipyrimidine photo-lyase [Alphaproteobacteria bacterium]|jgi:deoxyribodipyrimidine photo-lyase|nr:deoxyribodipyrimidine photo-lyase [Alphaproteobacteria bacterium]
MPASAPAPLILWFRLDLRLADNPALAAAVASGRPILPVFVLDDADAGARAPGGAARWWLHRSLVALARDLDRLGSRLILRRGAVEAVLDRLIAETGAAAVHWNRRYEPWATARDTRIKAALKDRGLEAKSHAAGLLFEPWTVRTSSGGPYRVYTPFWRACRARAAEIGAPLPAPDAPLPAPAAWPESDRLDAWALSPQSPDWAGGLRAAWTPGEAGARDRLARFLDAGIDRYDAQRNLPGRPGTSGLSPHLHWGEIGPRQVWHAVVDRLAAAGRDLDGDAEVFVKEIVWREFAHHLLFHAPTLPDRPMDPRFAAFPWADDPDGAQERAWQRGRTGYPIVDAGMRELWHTGWMHNRVRMIVASFLVKHLLLPWQAGEAWFWDCLVDADLASNSASWQWVAGCGADAAPYFRIFNPVLQGEKFDPDGRYVRHWVPEVADLPDRWLHKPWQAPPLVCREAGLRLGRDYPAPIVDHKTARQRALDAYAMIKTGATAGTATGAAA